ncbi:hypothetical protein [Microbulbifer variabilis]|uniref:hypothetical protein n=1 Tax=Microbulbifer variabilis TaxID=266805 RepID=UPI001CFEEBF6|nr:hypothetical protein [Microbulbifer variabilis]
MIYAFVKIFTEKEHAEAFIKGDLFMQTVSAFKEHRDSSGELRGDPMEGIVAWYQPTNVKVEVGGNQILSEDIAAPIAIHSKSVLDKNAFCIYSLNSRGFEAISAQTLRDFKSILEIHESCYGLGAYCVAVLNAQEFINRCSTAIKDRNLEGSMGLVDYFDELNFSGNFPAEKHGYQKRSFFSRQREYRIVLDINRTPSSSFTLNIGDLSDITSNVISPSEFNKHLEISLPDGSIA